MTQDLFDKYIWLVDTIYRARNITFEEINERWLRSQLSEGVDLPLRTFHNWRKAIEKVFDINIECDRRHGYYYYIENAEDMERGGIRNWLLNTFAVNNLINESHHLKRRILFEEIPSGRDYLAPVIEAMRDSLKIEISHKGYFDGEAKVYTISPYCVKVFRQRWYVVGLCDERNAVRTFSLDRILRLDTTDNKFTYPKDFDPEAWFSSCFGIITEDIKPGRVRIKVYGRQRMYLRSLRLHSSQTETETYSDYSVFEYYIKPTFDFRQELLSRGGAVEVLSPGWFRDAMADEVADMAVAYGLIKK